MQWLLSLDISVFRLVNDNLANPLFDVLMPFVSGNALFAPILFLVALMVLWKGRARGLIFVLALSVIVPIGDGVVYRTIKDAVGRPRPFQALENVKRPDLAKESSPSAQPAPASPDTPSPAPGTAMTGTRYRSMPSSHAANWFAATMIALIYYRRSLYLMLPLACLVGFSRIYNGVHYPSDVLAGAIIGAGYAAAMLWLAQSVWTWAGRKWFPIWHRQFSSILNPRDRMPGADVEEEPEPIDLPKVKGMAPAGFIPPHQVQDAQWVRLGALVIFALMIGRLFYIAGHTIQLSEDEAYQWVWSKHLALSYFSKPPMIAYTQFLGTSIWGDCELGVRFFSPVISAVMSFLVLRFFAREFNGRAGFFLVLIASVTPLLAVGSVLMTVDPLSVMFWILAMLAGWKAIQDKATTKDWAWVGLWTGFGFLSKYTALLQLVSWALLFLLWKPARKQLRQPGPWFALLVLTLCSLPVVIWNWQHDWITVKHVADNASVGKEWKFPRFFLEFIGAEFGLMNPVFFVASAWACIAFWRTGRQNPRLLYCFSMGAPLFLVYTLHSLKSRVLPNWIAPSILPLLMLMVAYWDSRLRLGQERVKTWLVTGFVVGLLMVVPCYNTDLVEKLTGRYLPVRLDPLHRVRDWDTTARVAGQARDALQKADGKPTFIICEHYGFTAQISFYLPDARANIKDKPEVYFVTTDRPENQFYFWPGYTNRTGQNAVYIRELDRRDPQPEKIPPILLEQFESVTELGISNVWYHEDYLLRTGKVGDKDFLLRPLQILACRNLR